MATIDLSVAPIGYELVPVYPRQEWKTQTGARLVNNIAGSRWRLRLTFRVGEEDRNKLLADLVALLEGDGYWRVNFGTMLGYKRQGTILATTDVTIPRTSTGSTATVDFDATPADTGYIERGDVISIGDEVKVCRGRTSDAGLLNFWPAIRGTLTGSGTRGVEVVEPEGKFYLFGNPPPVLFRTLQKGQMIEFRLELEES